jgi:two-component system, OmpR family, response regulator MprA
MRVLIADDDKLICDLLAQFVRFCGHEVVATVSGGGLAVIQSFARLQPDVVLLDVLMPRFNGITVCHALLSRKPDTKVILMSGMVDEKHPFISTCGATAFLRKPMHIEDLQEVFDSLAAADDRVIRFPQPKAA